MKRVLSTLIVTPPLLLWLALAVLTLCRVPRKVHTGDAFVDAYVQTLVDRGGLPQSEPWLPETKWHELEQQFSNDPRFWWVCFLHRSGVLSNYPDPDVFLFEAWRRGKVDLPILLSLYMSTSCSIEDTISNKPNYPQFSTYSDPGALSKCIHDRRVLLDELDDHSAEDVLAKMRQCASNHPLPYYLEAMLAGERKQYANALSLLRTGNSIAAREWRHGDTLSELYEPLVSRSLVSSDALLADFIAERSDISLDRLSFGFDSDVETLAFDSVQLGRMDIVSELHKMGCYLSIATGYDWAPTELGLSACRTVQELVAQRSSTLDPDKSEALSGLLHELNATHNFWWSGKDTLPHNTQQQVILLKYKSGIACQVELLLDSASRGYYQPGNLLLGIIPDLDYSSYLIVRRKPGYQAVLDKMFSELLRFDYTTCSFRDPPAPPVP